MVSPNKKGCKTHPDDIDAYIAQHGSAPWHKTLMILITQGVENAKNKGLFHTSSRSVRQTKQDRVGGDVPKLLDHKIPGLICRPW